MDAPRRRDAIPERGVQGESSAETHPVDKEIEVALIVGVPAADEISHRNDLFEGRDRRAQNPADGLHGERHAAVNRIDEGVPVDGGAPSAEETMANPPGLSASEYPGAAEAVAVRDGAQQVSGFKVKGRGEVDGIQRRARSGDRQVGGLGNDRIATSGRAGRRRERIEKLAPEDG